MNASRHPWLGLGAALLLSAGEARSHGLWVEPGAAGCKVFFGEPEQGLRETKDKLSRFLTLKGWKADGSAQVDVLAPNGWSRQVEADKDGKVEVPAPWPGLYVLKVSWKDKTPGEFKGKRYETASHNLAVSFVKP